MKRLKYPTPLYRDWKGVCTSPKSLVRNDGKRRIDSLDQWVDFILEGKDISGAKYDAVIFVERERDRVRQVRDLIVDKNTQTERNVTFQTPRCGTLCGVTGACENVNKLAEDGIINENERKVMRSHSGSSKEFSSQLNPDWVEWLMGWPVGWTDLAPLSKESFEKWKADSISGDYWAMDPGMYAKDDPAYLPRLTHKREHRADRLKAIGNGQVPLCIMAFEEIL